jgi:hypothetical protein
MRGAGFCKNTDLLGEGVAPCCVIRVVFWCSDAVYGVVRSWLFRRGQTARN